MIRFLLIICLLPGCLFGYDINLDGSCDMLDFAEIAKGWDNVYDPNDLSRLVSDGHWGNDNYALDQFNKVNWSFFGIDISVDNFYVHHFPYLLFFADYIGTDIFNGYRVPAFYASNPDDVINPFIHYMRVLDGHFLDINFYSVSFGNFSDDYFDSPDLPADLNPKGFSQVSGNASYSSKTFPHSTATIDNPLNYTYSVVTDVYLPVIAGFNASSTYSGSRFVYSGNYVSNYANYPYSGDKLGRSIYSGALTLCDIRRNNGSISYRDIFFIPHHVLYRSFSFNSGTVAYPCSYNYLQARNLPFNSFAIPLSGGQNFPLASDLLDPSNPHSIYVRKPICVDGSATGDFEFVSVNPYLFDVGSCFGGYYPSYDYLFSTCFIPALSRPLVWTYTSGGSLVNYSLPFVWNIDTSYVVDPIYTTRYYRWDYSDYLTYSNLIIDKDFTGQNFGSLNGFDWGWNVESQFTNLTATDSVVSVGLGGFGHNFGNLSVSSDPVLPGCDIDSWRKPLRLVLKFFISLFFITRFFNCISDTKGDDGDEDLDD